MLEDDRTGEVMFGIDGSRRGLLCRASVGCRRAFPPKSQNLAQDLRDAIVLRDAHELTDHGYTHQTLDTKSWGFAQRMTHRGRSTISSK